MATRSRRLSVRDEAKPLILIAAILVGIVLNRLLGAGAEWLIRVVEIGVFLVIFAVMLPVEITEVSHAFRKVKPTALALFVNFLFIPFFAWSLGWLFLRQHPDVWAGVILYTLTPCIGWYLIFIDLAQGDVPWGMALLPWNITLQVALMPLYLYLLVGKVLPLDLWALARSVVLYLFLPFALAHVLQRSIIARRGRGDFFGPVKRFMDEVKLWSLVLVIVAMFASQRALGVEDLGRVTLIIGVIAVFFLALFTIALTLGRLAGLPYEETATLAFTTTARNSEAVIGVAVSAFPGHPLVYLAVILGLIVELPMLLVVSRILLALKGRVWQPVRPTTSVTAPGGGQRS
ncbi:MAG: arsenic resistance protein [Armatimonadota bacterium]|nr:arsenic resistance protein [Armatimonadota bacterium]